MERCGPSLSSLIELIGEERDKGEEIRRKKKEEEERKRRKG